jgi:arsenite/tail-anchored protein-transporting ATPase
MNRDWLQGYREDMAIKDILNSNFILFGGKGGVGKTTCAAAIAVALLPRKVLVVSSDPAHSLGDCFGQKIGDEIVKVEQTESLYALEISAQNSLERFKHEYQAQMRRLLETSAGIEHLTRSEREHILSLPIPGADEVMGIKRLMDLMEDGSFEKIILDTAPTGHALRLLSMPDIFDKWINTFYHFRDKHRILERVFRKPDRADQFLISLKASTEKLRNLLRSDKTEFVVVTAAERVVLEETKDLVEHLNTYGIIAKHMIINKLFPDLGTDFSKMRRIREQQVIREIREAFSQLQIVEINLQTSEPRGVDGLSDFAGLIIKG